MNATSRQTLLTIIVALVIFVAGTVTGAGVASMVIVKRLEERRADPDLSIERVADGLRRRLDLTPSQAEAVAGILRRRQPRMLEFRERLLQQTGPELTAMEAEIAALLTPQQQELWKHRVEKLHHLMLPPLKNKPGPARRPPWRDRKRGFRPEGELPPVDG